MRALKGLVPGLAKGMSATARTMVRHAHTAEYPDVRPELPPRSRGVIALLEENCTSCMLCARECPDWCIYIDAHKETVPATTPGGRDRQRNVLDRFAIDFSLCMYCGICIEVCPFDALFWSPQFEYAETDIRDLLHEKERLGGWMESVPPPPALDAAAADPAEIAAQRAPARPASAAGGDRPERPQRPERPRPTRGEAGELPEPPLRGAAGERPERPQRPARPARGPAGERAPRPDGPVRRGRAAEGAAEGAGEAGATPAAGTTPADEGAGEAGATPAGEVDA